MATTDVTAAEDPPSGTQPWVFDADGTFPGSSTDLLETDELDAFSARRVLRDNALRLYGLDG
ncbi:MAG: hypothetical protein ACRDY6_23135 [Acidimicrobiia bacterium]